MIFDHADVYINNSVTSRPKSAVSFYLMGCYAYYEEDDPIMSDGLFDKICKDLLYLFDTNDTNKIAGHINFDLLDIEALRAGSGNQIKYPTRVGHAVRSFRHLMEVKANVSHQD